MGTSPQERREALDRIYARQAAERRRQQDAEHMPNGSASISDRIDYWRRAAEAAEKRWDVACRARDAARAVAGEFASAEDGAEVIRCEAEENELWKAYQWCRAQRDAALAEREQAEFRTTPQPGDPGWGGW